MPLNITKRKYLLPENEAKLIDALGEISFSIKGEILNYISEDALKKINQQYNVEHAVKNLSDIPKHRFIFNIGGNPEN